MVEAEEQREKARADAIHEQEEKDRQAGKVHHKKKKEHKDDAKKDEGEDGKKVKEK